MSDRICSFEGCGRPHAQHGLCDAHDWQRRKARPLTPIASRAWPERFWAKVEKSDSCWLWVGAIQGAGYGNTFLKGNILLSHRVAYELLVGPIPDGLVLDHLCRVRRCVNPRHLEPVTMRENILRGIAPPAIHAQQTHCKRGHPFDEANTLVRSSKYGTDARRCLACKEAAAIEREVKRKAAARKLKALGDRDGEQRAS